MEGIVLREARVQDIPAIQEIYGHYVRNTAISFEYETPSVSELTRRMEQTMRRYPYLVAEAEGELLGYAYAGSFIARAAYDWCCEGSIYLAPEARGLGLGRLLYRELELRLRKMGILKLYACIAVPMEEGDPYLTRNSVDFHRHMGYQTVGEFPNCGYKLGRWYGMVWMERSLGSHLSPAPPRRNHQEIKGD